MGALVTFAQEEESLAGKPDNKRLAALNTFECWAAQTGGSQPWYKSAQTKKEKVKVDMAWGVAAIRGSIFSVSAGADSCSMSLLDGEGEFRNSAGEAVVLSPGQSSNITAPGETPAEPRPFDETVQELWSDPEVQNILIEMAETMDANQPRSQESSPAQEAPRMQEVIAALQNQNIPVTTTVPNVPAPVPAQEIPAQENTAPGSSTSGGSSGGSSSNGGTSGSPSSPQSTGLTVTDESGKHLIAFAPTTYIYRTTVDNATDEITVTATAASSNASVTAILINDNTLWEDESVDIVLGSSKNISLAEGVNVIIMTLIDGTSTADYKLVITRASTLLRSINLSEGTTMLPAFASSTKSYTINAEPEVGSIIITPEAKDSLNAIITVTVDGQEVEIDPGTTNDYSVDLGGSSHTVIIMVENGTIPRTTYNLTINRGSGWMELSGLCWVDPSETDPDEAIVDMDMALNGSGFPVVACVVGSDGASNGAMTFME